MRIRDIKVGKIYYYDKREDTRKVLAIGETNLFIRLANGKEEVYSKNAPMIRDWVEIQEPHYRWINLYDRRTDVPTGHWDSKEEADEVALRKELSRPARRIACLRIDLNTGDIKKEDI